MKLLMLNTKAKLIGETNISKGTVNASLITPRELFIEALQKNAVKLGDTGNLNRLHFPHSPDLHKPFHAELVNS